MQRKVQIKAITTKPNLFISLVRNWSDSNCRFKNMNEKTYLKDATLRAEAVQGTLLSQDCLKIQSRFYYSMFIHSSTQKPKKLWSKSVWQLSKPAVDLSVVHMTLFSEIQNAKYMRSWRLHRPRNGCQNHDRMSLKRVVVVHPRPQ